MGMFRSATSATPKWIPKTEDDLAIWSNFLDAGSNFLDDACATLSISYGPRLGHENRVVDVTKIIQIQEKGDKFYGRNAESMLVIQILLKGNSSC